MLKLNKETKISIIGTGYIGLPLAVEFGKYFNVLAFDINVKRITDLINKNDKNYDITKNEINSSKFLNFSSNHKDLLNTDIFIITLPTPININKKPDLTFLKEGCILISKYISKNSIIIFESTVYPGLTENYCVPILEKKSNLFLNKDFFVGYSPERINPGDKKHKLSEISKIVSASNDNSLDLIYKLYKKIIRKKIYKASSIKIAEAAKVIENCQRDLNIAFINELYLIFEKLNLNTYEILEAAKTKWNFLDFTPGLVGGHCIGVDPYYLTFLARKNNYEPKVILSGRKINDSMSKSISSIFLNKLKKEYQLKNSKILIMGITFKGNCPDIRNSKIIDIYNNLLKKCKKVEIYDPIADKDQVIKNYKIKLINKIGQKKYEGIMILVDHDIFKNIGFSKIYKSLKKKGIIYDFKNIFISNKKNLIK